MQRSNETEADGWRHGTIGPKGKSRHTPTYVDLFRRAGDFSLCAILSKEDAGLAMFPFILRPLSEEKWAGKNAEGLFDIITPYGYGGPFSLEMGRIFPDDFWNPFEEWARKKGVVSCFARLSLFEEQLVPFRGEVVEKGPNVVRSLSISEEELWRDYAHKVRKNVKRARRSGLVVELDEDGERLDDFLDIYKATMDRREAGRGYYFPRSFFERIVRDLPGGYAFFHALSSGKVVSTEMVLVSANHIYSFLGGTRSESFSLRPNDLLKHEIIRWGSSSGKKTFVLGGGYKPSDGIYRYKLSFAPKGVRTFYVGEKIFDKAQYETLIERRRKWESAKDRCWHPTEGFFPSYRT